MVMHQDKELLQRYKRANPEDHLSAKAIPDDTDDNAIIARSLTKVFKDVSAIERALKDIADSGPLVAAAKALIENSTTPSQGPHSQEYDDDHGGLFNLTKEGLKAIHMLFSLDGLSEIDKGRLWCSINKCDRMPDAISPFENSEQVGRFDKQRLDYVCQRHVSCAVTQTRHATLQHCTALMYDFTHKHAIRKNERGMLSRLESLCLGYNYSHMSNDRPAELEYLHQNNVIPFIYYNKKAILDQCREQQGEKELSPACREQQGEKDLSPVNALDAMIKHSPLFKHVVLMAKSNRIEADALIDELFKAWKKTDLGHGGDQARHDLAELIVKSLLSRRYEQVETKKLRERHLKSLQKTHEWLSEVVAATMSFKNFLDEYGHKLESVKNACPKWSSVNPSFEAQDAPQRPRPCWRRKPATTETAVA